jgi:hypothetical protein
LVNIDNFVVRRRIVFENISHMFFKKSQLLFAVTIGYNKNDFWDR